MIEHLQSTLKDLSPSSSRKKGKEERGRKRKREKEKKNKRKEICAVVLKYCENLTEGCKKGLE